MKPLSIVAFSDGRPGHEKQTRGVLTAIAELTPCNVSFRSVTPGSAKAAVIDWIRYFGLRLFLERRVPEPSLDLVIGAGAYTHVPMLALKRKSGARAVTCMTPGFPMIRDMDLCLVPEHDGRSPGPNIFQTIGPPNTVQGSGGQDRSKGLILVGGIDDKSHRWSTAAVTGGIRTLLEKNTAIDWTISSSPRTPKETVSALERIAEEKKKVAFFDSASTPPGWIERQYGQNYTVWVTADSMSMIFEALTAGCCVGVIAVDWKRKDSKLKRSIDSLVDRRWVTPFECWRDTSKMESAGARLNEAARCAQEILKRWWPERLRSSN
jgi:mitochondrial fission protein ELM1